MKGWVNSLLVAILAAVPTGLLIGDYITTRSVNWILFVVWVVIVMLCVAFTNGSQNNG
jgi:predicted MFS family arabinose efflux permease